MGLHAQNGFHLGATGVDLFFIISGFVITMSISAVSNGKEFVINRVSRLYPTYWAAVTFTFALIAAYDWLKSEPIPWVNYLGNMTMFQYYLNIPDLDPPYWTMIVEMNFYILMLLLFQLGLVRFVIGIGLFLTVSSSLVSTFFWNEITQSVFKAVPLLKFFPLFFAGIVFYEWRTSPGKYWYILILVICIVAQANLYNVPPGRGGFFSQTEYAGMLLLFFTLFLLFVRGKLSFVVNRPMLFLGKISFALYLTHQYVLLAFLMPLLVNRLKVNYWVSAFLICLPVAILIATAITFLIDVPYSVKMRRALSNKLLQSDATHV